MTEETKVESRRRPRSLDSREFETRKSQERAPMAYQNISKYNLPEYICKNDPDHEYGWIVYMSSNHDANDNYYDARERGWDPVLASMHPELSRIYSMDPHGQSAENQFIRRGGQILMKRALEYLERENREYDVMKGAQLDNINRARVYDENDENYFMDHRFNPNVSPSNFRPTHEMH